MPSHRGDEARGFLEGLGTAREISALASIVHGTTVGTNALLERKGACIGLITTRGFRDVIEMRRRDRRNTWGLWGDFAPVVDRDLRLEVGERTLASGEIRAGERVRLETPGGGGWGEPRERDRRRVAREVRLGYVGAAGAREVYEVVLAVDACVDEQPAARRDRNDA